MLALREEGRLVGLAPLFIRPASFGIREVLLLGTGISDYLDVLLEPGAAAQVSALLFEHLHANQERWDICDFQQLRPGSALLDAAAPHAWRSALNVQEVCPVLKLPKTGDSLSQRVPAHMLDKLWYYRRRLHKLGPVAIESAGPENFAELLENFITLHQRRWAARGQDGVLHDPRLQRFHREAAQRMLEAGVLRLYALRSGVRIVASLYGFSHRGRTLFYLSGFDPEISAFGPGALMIGHAIEQAVREGAEEFDFLRGRESYKYLWGAKGRLNCRRRFTRNAGVG